MKPELKWALDTCTFCPDLCQAVCPVGRSTGVIACSTWGKMSLLGLLEKGLITPEPGAVEALYRCVGCLACTSLCEHSVPAGEVLFEARGRYSRPPSLPPVPPRPDLEALLAPQVPPERRVEEAMVAYLPGREVLEARPAAVGAAMRLFGALGIQEVAVTAAATLDDGSVQREAGDWEEAWRLGAVLVQRVSRYKKVVVHGAHLLHLLRDVLPARGLHTTARVVALPDELAARSVELDVSRLVPEGRALAWHDPCLLARGGAGSNGGAGLLERVARRPVIRLAHHGTNTWCCGRGAAYHALYPENAREMAALSVDEARTLGAELLVTGCPAAAAAFESAGMPALDLTEYLAQRLVEA
jgi:Fe-S oxidoreductase